MLQFLQPIWLWAISGIIIPLIIHLWNIRQGKVLKVGSIAFLQNSSKQYAKSFKINDWLLLLLRCLLIILASLLLSGPHWKQSTTDKEKGWLIMDKQGFNEGYGIYKPVVDSLIKSGYSLHYFNDGFTTTTLPKAIKDSGLNTNNETVYYWDLIGKLDKKLNGSLPVYLITDNQLKHFVGDRPVIETNVRWLTYLPKDTMGGHLAKAFLTYDDSIRLVVANSSPTVNTFSVENLSAKVQSVKDYKTSLDNGKWSVQYKNDAAILVDTTALEITIYSAQNNNDASYLKAAINAIQSFTKRKIKLQVVKSITEITANQDWLFWLNEQPLPENVTAKNILMYAGGKEETTNSWINTLASHVDNNRVQLFRRTVPATVSAQSQLLWKDGFGNAVLTKDNTNGPTIYRFYNRFDPAWTNLVWENGFPALLTSILFKADTTTTTDDKRIIDEQQLQPAYESSNKSTTQLDASATDISNIVWICLFIVFFIERLVSFHTKKADV